MKEEVEIKKLIDNKRVISFDIFDTLLLRNIETPTDIFKIMEEIIKNKYNIEDFYNDRINAEMKSRLNIKNGESNINEIYNQLDNKYTKYLEEIKNLEYELELRFIEQNKMMKNILDYCIANDKKVILITDMYLSKEFIEKLLKKAGFKKLNIYVSNEIRESKHLGGLYEYVKAQEKLDYKNWLHIGDNLHSDVDIPKSYGISVYHYHNISYRFKRYTKSHNYKISIMRGIQNNYLLNNNLSYWEEFGIKYASPLYYSFTEWLYELTKDKDNLYFLSRDGYIIKKIYDLFLNANNKVKPKYLYTSRLAYELPINYFENKKSFIDSICNGNSLFKQYETVESVFNLLDINYNDYEQILKRFGDFNKNTILIDNNKHTLMKFKKFLIYIYDDLKEKYTKKINNLKQYLKQEGINDYDCINIVDIGWRGSLQKYIGLLVGKKVFGYYFGTTINAYDIVKNNSLGYSFDSGIYNDNSDFILDNIMMFELLFSSPEGTLLDFKNKNGRIAPILETSREAERSVELFQTSSIKIIKKYIEYYDLLKNIKIEDSIIDYKDYINYKRYDDLKAFNKLENDVGYGTKKKKYVNEFELNYIIDNYEDFKKEISKSLWKNSYLIKDCNSQESLEENRETIYNIHSSNNKIAFNMKTIKKALGNPKKALEVIKYKIKRR